MGFQTITDSTDNLDGKNAEVVASVNFGRVSSDTVAPIEIDSYTHSQSTIEEEHHQIHEGNHFFIASYETLGDGDVADFVVETPDSSTEVHMVFMVEGTDTVSIEVYEDVDAAADGAVQTPYNSNRNSSNTSVATIRKNPTVNDAGTLLLKQKTGARNKIGITSRVNELVLKKNTKYLYRITSHIASNIVTYIGEWYECESN